MSPVRPTRLGVLEALVGLSFLGGAVAWVTTAQYQRDAAATPLSTFKSRAGAINRLWSSPTDSTLTRGLGMGITYAWDPVVCGMGEPCLVHLEHLACSH